jgi:hypothetical protein
MSSSSQAAGKALPGVIANDLQLLESSTAFSACLDTWQKQHDFGDALT